MRTLWGVGRGRGKRATEGQREGERERVRERISSNRPSLVLEINVILPFAGIEPRRVETSLKYVL